MTEWFSNAKPGDAIAEAEMRARSTNKTVRVAGIAPKRASRPMLSIKPEFRNRPEWLKKYLGVPGGHVGEEWIYPQGMDVAVEGGGSVDVDRVIKTKNRLAKLGYLIRAKNEAVIDDDMSGALREVQEKHGGLIPTGHLDVYTYWAINQGVYLLETGRPVKIARSTVLGMRPKINDQSDVVGTQPTVTQSERLSPPGGVASYPGLVSQGVPRDITRGEGQAPVFKVKQSGGIGTALAVLAAAALLLKGK